MTIRKSIVLVTVDCLRADHVGFMGYRRPTTPFLDSMAHDSFVFPAAIVAGAPTYYSFPAIMASRYPLAFGREVLGLGPEESTLASVLKDAGYATASFTAGNPYISSRFGYEKGFENFGQLADSEPAQPSRDDPKRLAGSGWASRLNRKFQGARAAIGPLGIVYDELYFRYCQRVTPIANSLDALRRFPAADVIVDQACSWLASVGDKPFFIWLHLMDPHSPYYPKDAAVELMGAAKLTPRRARDLNESWNRSDLGPRRLASYREEIVGLYDAGVRWVDVQMERLTQALRNSGRWDDCIFALTADHGEEFLDHGGRFHPPSRLMEELIHVPLLLRVPGSQKKELAKSPFSLLHLAPTLLDAVDVAAPAAFRGRSYWPEVTRGSGWDTPAISECVEGCSNPYRRENRMGPRVLSVREKRFKLTLHPGPAAENLYDLESDPGEQSPLAPSAQKAVRRRLLEVAREHLRSSTGRRNQRDEVQARLRDLRLEWARPSQPSVAG
jgi:arylsulfatase A-like enzyme